MKSEVTLAMVLHLTVEIEFIRCFSLTRLSPLYADLNPRSTPLAQTVAVTAMHCARDCDDDVTCKGYFYNNVSRWCAVYSASFYSIAFVQQAGVKAYEVLPKQQSDCYDVMMNGMISGVYQIVPRDNGPPISVYCESTSHDGGWLVIQRRTDGSEDFYRIWNDYRDGFGDLNNEFWLGNTNIHRLTSQGKYDLRIDLEDFDGNRVYAQYDNFSIESEQDYFRLHIGTYSGDAGDSMTFHNGQYFTSKDVDRDSQADDNCAEVFNGGWWYADCHLANLNGLYLRGNHSEYAIGVNWYHFRGHQYSLKYTAMKVRPSPFVN